MSLKKPDERIDLRGSVPVLKFFIIFINYLDTIFLPENVRTRKLINDTQGIDHIDQSKEFSICIVHVSPYLRDIPKVRFGNISGI